jgi:SAM-dependent methyltransferase
MTRGIVAQDSVERDDWDRHWEDLEEVTAVNPAQKYRRTLILAALDLDRAPHAKILDIGSGLGDLLVDLHALYPGIPKIGIELSRRGVEIASRRLPQARFLQRNLIADNNNPAEYRAFATHAVCSEVLEHVDDPVRLLRNSQSYLAPGCRLVVTVPGGPKSQFDLGIGHRRHFTPHDLQNVLSEAGFRVEYTSGAGFPFFNLYRLMVILRGKRLVTDAEDKPSVLLKIVSRIFDWLFVLNLSRSALGWQTIGVARL